MRNALLVRKAIHFEVKLLSILCETPFDRTKKEVTIYRKKKIKNVMRSAERIGQKVTIHAGKVERKAERIVDDLLSWDPWIADIPQSMKGK